MGIVFSTVSILFFNFMYFCTPFSQILDFIGILVSGSLVWEATVTRITLISETAVFFIWMNLDWSVLINLERYETLHILKYQKINKRMAQSVHLKIKMVSVPMFPHCQEAYSKWREPHTDIVDSCLAAVNYWSTSKHGDISNSVLWIIHDRPHTNTGGQER